jgi:hypothetical protein
MYVCMYVCMCVSVSFTVLSCCRRISLIRTWTDSLRLNFFYLVALATLPGSGQTNSVRVTGFKEFNNLLICLLSLLVDEMWTIYDKLRVGILSVHLV